MLLHTWELDADQELGRMTQMIKCQCVNHVLSLHTARIQDLDARGFLLRHNIES